MERSKDNSKKGSMNCPLYHGLEKTEGNFKSRECKNLLNTKYDKTDDTGCAFKACM